MRKYIYLLIFIGLGLSSCQKEENVENKLNLSITGEKLAAIIPPISNPSATIRRSKNVCINSAQANFDTLYVTGSNTNPHTNYMVDTTVGVHLDYMASASGILRYRFIKGNRYTITIPVKYLGKDKSGWLSLTPKTYMPYFSAYTLKTLNSTNIKELCMSNFSNLRTSNDPIVSSSFVSGAAIPPNETKTHTLTFTANECFEYIGFTFQNNSSDDRKSIYVGSIKINSEPLLEFNGEKKMCLDEIQTVSYGAAGFTVSDPVYWHTTGDLQIVGSNYGATVQIKCTGSNGGTVALNSCSNTVDESNIKFNIEAGSTTTGSINGDPILPFGESRDYTILLQGGNTDTKWSVSYYPNVTLTKLSNNKVRLSTTGSVPLGTVANLTLRVRAISKCGIASNEVTRNLKFVYDREPRIE